MPSWFRPRGPGCWAAVALAFAGCSSPADRVATVSGLVTLQGKPLTGGRIFFHSQVPDAQVRMCSAVIDPDGKYVATDVGVGPAKIAVDTEWVKSLLAQWDSPTKPRFKFVPVAAKYAKPDASGLTLDIKPGKQEFDIALEP